MVEAFVVASKAYHSSAPATFETIDTGHRFMLVVGLWNAPEVIGRRALAPGPADRIPLQQVVGHQVAVFITRGPIEVDRLTGHAAYEATDQQLHFEQRQRMIRMIELLPS